MSAPPPPGPAGRRAWQTLFLLLVGAGLLVLAYHLRAIFVPLLVALALAYILNPLVDVLERRGVGRVWSIAGLYVVFFGGVAAAALFALPALAHQGVAFFEEVFVGEDFVDRNGNGAFDEGDQLIDANANGRWDGPKIARVTAWSRERLKEYTGAGDLWNQLKALREKTAGHEGEIARAVGRAVGTAAGWVATGVSGIIAVVSFVVLVPVYMFFMLKNMNAIWERSQAAIPAPYRERVVATLGRIHRANAAFFRGQVTIALIEGVILTVVLAALGIRFSFLFGVLYAVAAMVPFVGVALMFGVTELFVFVDGDGFKPTFFLVAGLFVFIQVLEGFVLQPFILGKETGLHPVAIILSIFIFGELFGFLGVLLAVPLASAAIIVAKDHLFPMVREVTEPQA